MAAPVFAAEYGDVWSSSTSPKTASVPTNVGDVLVVCGATVSASVTLNTPTGGTGLTWTLRQSVNITGRASLYVWTATATASETVTLSVTRGATSGLWGFVCLRFSGASGVGASAKADAASSAPSLALVTQQPASAIVVADVSYAPTSEGARTWRTGAGALTEQSYYYSFGNYAVFGGYHADAGVAGSKTVGLTAPTQTYSVIAVEVQGTANKTGEFLPFFI